MGKLLNPNDKEYMKMAMLKHEETFKEQVYELHRLYRIQKVLMRNINGQERRNSQNEVNRNGHLTETIQHKKQRKIDLESPAEEYITAESDAKEVPESEEETETELTLGLRSYYSQRKKSETPLTSDSGLASFSSSSTGSSHVKKTSCGIRQSASRNRRELEDLQGGRGESFHVEEQFRQQERLQQPPWLFQVLSLNMT